MTIYVFGNPDLQEDSLPLRMIPELKKHFPRVEFEIKDPNEEWNCPETLTIIDTVKGINEVKVFDGLAEFAEAPRVTLHDFDALANLRYLQKLGKLKKITIIGVPAEMPFAEAFAGVTTELNKFLR